MKKAVSKYLYLFDIKNEDFPTAESLAVYIKKQENLGDSIEEIKRELVSQKQQDSELTKIAQKVGLNVSGVNAWYKTKVGDDSVSILMKGNSVAQEDAYSKIVKEFESIVKNFKPSFKLKSSDFKDSSEIAVKATMSDAHVGMCVKNGLFDYEYSTDIFTKKVNEFFIPRTIRAVESHKATKVVISDLGDMADGWNGETTRGGHKLPQNATEVEVFRCILENKIEIIKALVDQGVRDVTLQSVGNDNHAGKFARVINEAIKQVSLAMNLPCKIDNLTKFIECRVYGDHAFLITHGKDEKEMKGGFPLTLEPKVETWFYKFKEQNQINSKYIHVEKGDLHQIAYNKVMGFDYRNFGTFAPPSSWIQHQKFGGACYSAFSIQAIHKYDNEVQHSDVLLDYKVKNQNKEQVEI